MLMEDDAVQVGRGGPLDLGAEGALQPCIMNPTNLASNPKTSENGFDPIQPTCFDPIQLTSTLWTKHMLIEEGSNIS